MGSDGERVGSCADQFPGPPPTGGFGSSPARRRQFSLGQRRLQSTRPGSAARGPLAVGRSDTSPARLGRFRLRQAARSCTSPSPGRLSMARSTLAAAGLAQDWPTRCLLQDWPDATADFKVSPGGSTTPPATRRRVGPNLWPPAEWLRSSGPVRSIYQPTTS